MLQRAFSLRVTAETLLEMWIWYQTHSGHCSTVTFPTWYWQPCKISHFGEKVADSAKKFGRWLMIPSYHWIEGIGYPLGLLSEIIGEPLETPTPKLWNGAILFCYTSVNNDIYFEISKFRINWSFLKIIRASLTDPDLSYTATFSTSHSNGIAI